MTLPFRKYSNDPNFFGYPLFYIVEGECVCADCCNDAWENEEEFLDDFLEICETLKFLLNYRSIINF